MVVKYKQNKKQNVSMPGSTPPFVSVQVVYRYQTRPENVSEAERRLPIIHNKWIPMAGVVTHLPNSAVLVALSNPLKVLPPPLNNLLRLYDQKISAI